MASASMGIESQFGGGRGGRGRVVITASNTMDYAFEGDELADARDPGPSVFTSALVEGLKTGDADRDLDGTVTLDELYDYIYEKVRATTPRQVPAMWKIGVEGQLVIARRARPPATPAPLPPELQTAIDSPLAVVRAAAVQDLARLLQGTHAGLALAAQLALRRLTEDDSRSVAARADAALGPQSPPGPELSVTAVEVPYSPAQAASTEARNQASAASAPAQSPGPDVADVQEGREDLEQAGSAPPPGARPTATVSPIHAAVRPTGVVHNLDVEISSSEGGSYQVIARSDAAGDTPSMPIRFPFDEQMLGRRLQAVEFALMRSAATVPAPFCGRAAGAGVRPTVV